LLVSKVDNDPQTLHGGLSVGRHRDSAARRGVSRGPVIAVVVIVVLALATFGWFRLRENIAAQGASAAGNCVSGSSTLNVVANSSIAPTLTELADRFTATKPVVRDHCVQVVVSTANDQQVLASLRSGGENTGLGSPPAVWIPQDSSWTTELAAARPAVLTDKIRSVASSPALLAVPQPVAQAIVSAKLSWADLPALQGARDGWARFGQPGWGTATIAMPNGQDGSTAAALAAQAVGAGVSGTTPVTSEALRRPDVANALGQLQRGPAQPSSTRAALSAIHGLSAVAGSPFQAVPATEQQIFAAAQQPGATPLAAVALAGPTPIADFPFAILKTASVDNTQSRAAGAFADFLEQSEQQRTLTAAGFHAGAAPLPAPSPAVSFQPVRTVLTAPDAAASAAVNSLLAAPSGSATRLTSTVVLDVSSSMSSREDGSTRLQTVTSALGARIGELPDSAGVGLWTFSTDLDGGLPYRVDVPTGTLSEQGLARGSRRQTLQAVLPTLTAKTGTSLNFAVGAAYASAVQAYAAGQPNMVLVITDGRNDGRTTLSELSATIDKERNPAKPVRIDVVAIGAEPDTDALRRITTQTGGTLVLTSRGGELAAALRQLLA